MFLIHNILNYSNIFKYSILFVLKMMGDAQFSSWDLRLAHSDFLESPLFL
jgi:hypothetical protein